jgi:predicted AlkP superfamily pyrophosphatase or phosphodiesterase
VQRRNAERRARRWIGVALAVVGCSRAPVPQASAPAAGPLPTVVVVSFDALGDRFLARDSLPNFRRMIGEGVRAQFRPQFPSKTFPNHYSMATGLTPGEHGIVVNSFFDATLGEMFLRRSASDGKWFGGEPIWVTAERAGIRTAAYFWTGSEAEIKGVRPSQWKSFDATVADTTKLRTIMTWLRAPAAERPHLVMMYSGVIDGPSHRFGPESAQAFTAVRNADRILGITRDSLAALPFAVDLIVVSDHGQIFVPREHDIDMDALLPPAGVLVDDEHATFSIWQDPKGPRVNMDSLAAFYRKTIPHMRLFRPGEFPPEWRTNQNPRFGDIFMLADPGWEFVGTKPVPAVYTLGEHGYAPDVPEMMGIFLAAGPSFRQGVALGVRENRTLHELLIHLLRLKNPINVALPDFGLRK